MQIVFTKLSDRRHSVSVTRRDGSTEKVELESRSFLRHDLVHFAVEEALSIGGGFWGSVADGAPLGGEGIGGDDATLAESLTGPVQTLMRDEAGVEAYLSVLQRVVPGSASPSLAARLHELVRQLRGRWKATPYGGEMRLDWTDSSK